MSNLRELKKHLASVEMTGQMAGAMKTASAVKFSKISAALERFSGYAGACSALRERFGSALAEAYPAGNPDAPPCYVILGANRGLCGGYNIALYEYADRLIGQSPRRPLLITAGRHAEAHFRDRGIEPDAAFVLSDAPDAAEAGPVLEAALSFWQEGRASSVVLVWQRFVNTLTQVPDSFVLLPLKSGAGSGDRESAGDRIEPPFLPDRETVLRAAADACVRADFLSRIFEAGAGHQAATLATMRSAYDNAEETAAALTAEISHRRQSEVTSSVIETAGGNAGR